MPHFRDTDGRNWRIAFDKRSIDELQRAGLLAVASDRAFFESLKDAEKIGIVLYCLCRAQIEARGMSPEKFALAVAPVLDEATDAVIAAHSKLMQQFQKEQANG